MSYASTKHSESSASRMSMDGDTTEDGGDDRDETKRRSRNLSEKKRRDQFNVLINELCSMVSTSPRKMDKSTVLKATIAFLKAHNELSVQSQVQETQEDWKPSFLSNEEFTHLMMEALDGFIVVITTKGKILYLSESITALLGYLSTDLVNSSTTIYDYILPEDRNDLFSMLTNQGDDKYKGQVSMVLNFRVGGGLEVEENEKYQLVKLIGYFKRWISPTGCGTKSGLDKGEREVSESSTGGSSSVLIATGRLIICDLLREMSVIVDSEKNEFSSRHSLEWKFLFLDHRATPIIGYLPFEVLGTSGYDYYHVEDLEKVAICHEALMQRGEGTSCFYRFLTKGQQWIWLQTRFYITYHQWNSKPEFIVCTHRVVSYADVMKDLQGEATTAGFEDSPTAPRLGPTVPKQPKIEKGACPSLKNSSRHKNVCENRKCKVPYSTTDEQLSGKCKFSPKQLQGGLCYGSVGSKRNPNMRKLELPPKFAATLAASHPSLTNSPVPPPVVLPPIVTLPENIMSSSNGMSMPCPKPLTTSPLIVAHPQVSPLVHPISCTTMSPPSVQMPLVPATIALPVPYNTLPPPPTIEIVTSTHTQPPAPPPVISMSQGLAIGHSVVDPTCVMQDELLKKHAELQRQIFNQQEELRRVSEQLIMAQCGWGQGEPMLAPPTHNQSIHPQDNSAVQLQPLQYQPPLMTYSPHQIPPPPPSSNNPDQGLT